MLTIEEFKNKYPGEFCWGSFKEGIYPGTELVLEGLLQFTEDSAYHWAGPLHDGYAQFVLTDWTNAKFSAGPNKGKNVLRVWANNEADRKAKALRRGEEYRPYDDQPTLTHPVRLWMMGNDDTSYSKFYTSVQEAMDEITLFIANEPLEFKVVWDFNFIFTN
jgi:hypothetical protein